MIKETIRARQNTYSDLDFRFILNPNTGDLGLKKDVEAVKQSVMNILLTGTGERPFNPTFGGNLRSYLFENFDDVVEAAMKSTIISSLRNHEPRVKVDSVEITDLSYRNALRISLDITILSPEETTDVVEFVVERLR
jgi:phage baseplate assembly protein W